MVVCDGVSIIGSGQMGLSSPYDCHVYAVRGEGGVIVIDAGSGLAEPQVLEHLQRDFSGDPVVAILLTHSHADHAAGAQSLAAKLSCDLFAGEITADILRAGNEERNGLARARAMGGYPTELRLLPTAITRTLQHGEVFTLAGVTFTAMHVRGHSDDSFCFIADLPLGRALFSGDIVFYGGTLGVINTPDSGMQGYCADLHCLSKQDLRMLFPSHGLFTLRDSQQHVDRAIANCAQNFLPRQIGQEGGIF